MSPTGRLRAWIEQAQSGKVIAAFIGVTTLAGGQLAVADRKPAMRECCSADNARKWIESEASAIGLPVEWVDAASP